MLDFRRKLARGYFGPAANIFFRATHITQTALGAARRIVHERLAKRYIARELFVDGGKSRLFRLVQRLGRSSGRSSLVGKRNLVARITPGRLDNHGNFTAFHLTLDLAALLLRSIFGNTQLNRTMGTHFRANLASAAIAVFGKREPRDFRAFFLGNFAQRFKQNGAVVRHAALLVYIGQQFLGASLHGRHRTLERRALRCARTRMRPFGHARINTFLEFLRAEKALQAAEQVMHAFAKIIVLTFAACLHLQHHGLFQRKRCHELPRNRRQAMRANVGLAFMLIARHHHNVACAAGVRKSRIEARRRFMDCLRRTRRNAQIAIRATTPADFLCGDIDVFRACIGAIGTGIFALHRIQTILVKAHRMALVGSIAQRVKCNIVDKSHESPLFAAKIIRIREPYVW